MKVPHLGLAPALAGSDGRMHAAACTGRPEAAGLVPSINKVKTGFKTDICFTVPVGDHSGSTDVRRSTRAVAFVTIKIAAPDGHRRRDVIDALHGALVRALAEGFDRD